MFQRLNRRCPVTVRTGTVEQSGGLRERVRFAHATAERRALPGTVSLIRVVHDVSG